MTTKSIQLSETTARQAQTNLERAIEQLQQGVEALTDAFMDKPVSREALRKYLAKARVQMDMAEKRLS